MTRTLYRRDSLFMRFVSTIVALSFTLSLAGSGFAAPVVPDSSETTVAEAGNAAEPTSTAAPSDGDATEPSVEAEPTTTLPESNPTGEEPVPVAVPVKSRKSIQTQPESVTSSDGFAAAAPSAQAGSGDISIVDFQGYNSAQSKWTNGNLGKDYREGDWVPYRVVLKNTGDAPISVPTVAIGLDHFDSNPNAAVMFDKTRSWGFALSMTQPGTNDSPSAPAGFASVTPTSQDAPEGGTWGSAPIIRTDLPAGAFSLDPDEYVVVYFQGHLALTVYWNFIQPGTDGAAGYPGSSGHGYLEMDGGARTLPLPSVTTPGASIKIVKFYDTDQDGEKDAGETQLLSGWRMHLHGTDGFIVDIHELTDANGEAEFTPLPPGTYTVHEDMQAGWESNTTQPISVTVGSSDSRTVYIGNFHPDVTKTWSFSADALPSGGVPFVSYKVNGVSQTTSLTTGSGPYTGQVTVPFESSITDIAWYMRYAGENVLLGSSADETLTADKTNPFTYDSVVSGMKFADDGDGVKEFGESGLSGWSIVLKRVVGSTETTYAQTVTDSNGHYSFADVIPGTYKVYEVQQAGWFMTASPAGSFAVANGSQVTGKDFGNLQVASSIQIVKSGPSAVHEGDTVTYSFTVTNTGNNLLTGVNVSDPSLWGSGSHAIGALAAGASVNFTATRTAPAEPDPLPNTAVAMGYDVLGALVSDDDDHVVDIIKPAISVTKSADAEKIVLGDDVLYTYVVTNSGEDTLTGVVLTDDQFSVTGGSIGTLAPGASATLTELVPLSVTTTNVASVVGYDALGMMVQDSATEVVEVYNPSISIVKSADPTVILEGDSVTYVYLVTNTGDILLTNVTVTDDILGAVGTIPALAPGAFDTVSVTVPVSADVTNVGTAVGYYGAIGSGFYGWVTDSSSANVDVVAPSILVEKVADRTAVLAGESVTYTYVVYNTGDVPLVNVSLVDDKLGSVGTLADLAVDANATFTASAALAASTTNVVMATATDEAGHPVFDDASVTVPVYDPSISIVKTASPGVILSGETVLYEYLVTNTGDIDLHDIAVTDDILGSIDTIASLAPGAWATVSKSSAVSADVTNVGTALGHYGDVESDFHGTVSDTDDAFVDVIHPAIEVDKSASPSAVIVGGTVTYTFVVTNSGDVPLVNISVQDDKLGHIGDIASLGVGASQTLTASTALDESTTNVVTVTGTDEHENPVSDTDTETVPVYDPSISIVKTASPGVVLSGGMVLYTYSVTNTGDITLHDIAVTDDKLGPIGMIASLAPGGTAFLTASSAIAADVTNVGTALGHYGNVESDFHGTVSDTDDAVVDVIHPSIAVEKSVSASPVLSGSSVTYTYVVTNDGDVDLFNVNVVDDKLGTIGTIASLPVGASTTLSESTTLTESTVNVVTVTATDALQNPVSATDSASVLVFDPSISIVKTADPVVVLAGENVTYTYVVENTGDIELSPVNVIDDKLGAVGSIDSLAPGEVATLTASTAVSADVTNVGTATGFYAFEESEFGGSVSDSDDAIVDVVNPAIDVVKSASPTEIVAGENVVYTFTVTNIGDVDLFDVQLTDDKLGVVGALESLAVGASSTFSATTSLSVPTTNTVVAVGTDEFGHEVTDEAVAFVDVALPFTPPDVTIDKSADKSSAKAGDTVRYTLTYRNLGPGVAEDITIVDDFDERYVTITDAAGGTVADGKITWSVPGPLHPEDGPQTITYSVRIDSDLPADVRVVRNTVVISEPTEENTDNNTDRWSVDIDEEPFLPFTGGAWFVLALAVMAAGSLGIMFRRLSRVVAS